MRLDAASREKVIRGASWTLIAVVSLLMAATVVVAAIPEARSWFERTPARRGGYATGGSVGFSSAAGSGSSPSLIVFFESDCVPSRESRPALSDLVSSARRAGVRVELVTSPGDSQAASRFAADIGLDPADVAERDLRNLSVPVVPTVVVARPDRTVAMVHEGTVDEAAVHAIWGVTERLIPETP